MYSVYELKLKLKLMRNKGMKTGDSRMKIENGSSSIKSNRVSINTLCAGHFHT